MRPQQWVKNLLIFVPVLLAHQLRAGPIIAAILAAVAFSVCASAVYIVNDLLDIEADRQHPRKSRRPFASGRLPLAFGPPLAAGLFFGGEFLAALCIGWPFVAILTIYIAITTAYSFWLKREPIIDVLTLSGLYTIRIFAGGVASAVPISEWLVAFSVFLFLSLALVKRYSELVRLTRESRTSSAGRGYLTSDLQLLQTLGAVSGYLSVLVFALYTNSPEMKVLYHRPWALWMICPLMIYWISRIWLIAAREELGEDPVVFAVKDRASLLIGLLAAISVAIASMPG